jgi:phosphohistidine phosphatase SixA
VTELIVLRHATRRRDADPASDKLSEQAADLDEAGVCEAQRLAAELDKRGIRPALYFTSGYFHARRTSEILRDRLGGEPTPVVVVLRTLTPDYQGPPGYRSEDWTAARLARSVLYEAQERVPGLRRVETMMLVFHFPRCAQLLHGLTSRPESEFALRKAEGVILRADTFDGFLQGHGREADPRLIA